MEEAVNGDDDGGRASEKKAFVSNPSSVHKVLSNDDLLIEILLILPLLSLNLVKRVSKQWLSLIRSPSFISRLTQIYGCVPPSGLFISRSSYMSSAYDFLSFNSGKIVKEPTVFTYNSEISAKYSLIKQSCNGLLLCYVSDDYTKPFIYNPFTSEFKMLPPIHPFDYFPGSRYNYFRMAFDPTKSPHYKVVHAGVVQDVAVSSYSVIIQTYSSETGVWTVWDDCFPSRSFFGFESGIYCNGAIHWFGYGNHPFHFKLEFVDRLVLTNIQSPVTQEGKVHSDRRLFGSYGSLLLLCKDYYHSRKLNIYEMKNGYSEWSIKYIVNLDNMMSRTWKLPNDWCCYNIWSIFFGEREEDSFMVIELSGKVLQYKFVSKTVTKLLDVRKGVGEYGCHDFIASFAHV